MSHPHVIGIYITPTQGTPLSPVKSARAVPGKGLEGDRYFDGCGTFLKRPGVMDSQEATLIESEALDALKRDYEVELTHAESRRNIITRGIGLNLLIGCEFTIGTVRFKGVRLCEPCGHLESLTKPGARQGLIHRGGLRAQILSEGMVNVGDPIIGS